MIVITAFGLDSLIEVTSGGTVGSRCLLMRIPETGAQCR